MKKTTLKKITTLLTVFALALSMTLTAVADDSMDSRSATGIQYLQKQYPSGSTYSDEFDGATECMGFAYYCYYMYNDEHVNETISDSSSSSKYYSLSSDTNLEKFLKKAGTQCYVRGKTSSGAYHSIFIIGYSTSNDTVTVYDCNMDGKCTVLLDTYTYDEFRTHMSSVLFCYTSGEVFYDCSDF